MRTGRGLALAKNRKDHCAQSSLWAAIDLHSILQQIQCRMQQEDFMARPFFIDLIDAAVDNVPDTIAGDIVLGIPLGWANPTFVNALYRRIKTTRRGGCASSLRFRWKNLSARASWKSTCSHFRRSRVRGLPDLEYVKELRAGHLPENIEVREFFEDRRLPRQCRRTAAGYISTNYTFVARDMAVQG